MASVEKEILNWIKKECKDGAAVGYFDISSELIKDSINNIINPLFDGVLKVEISEELNILSLKILDEARINEVKTLCKLYR